RSRRRSRPRHSRRQRSVRAHAVHARRGSLPEVAPGRAAEHRAPTRTVSTPLRLRLPVCSRRLAAWAAPPPSPELEHTVDREAIRGGRELHGADGPVHAAADARGERWREDGFSDVSGGLYPQGHLRADADVEVAAGDRLLAEAPADRFDDAVDAR